jgi:endonuclease YncB( thermonuclease family)
VAGVLIVVITVIGIVAPASNESDDQGQEAVDAAGASGEPTTTEGTDQDETTAEEEAEPPPPPPPPRVARVIDGDTLALDDGSRVRLVQIDAPETDGECYAAKSTQTLRRLLPEGTKVRIVRDPRLDNRDRYDRLLRYVFKGGRNVNLVLVERGAASVWFFNGDRGRYAGKFERAADAARAKGRGAWGACEASTDYTHGWDTEERQKAATGGQSPSCHPSYKGACLDQSLSDYDCAGGSGDGPGYTGPVRVVGPDVYRLDSDGDGYGCESS